MVEKNVAKVNGFLGLVLALAFIVFGVVIIHAVGVDKLTDIPSNPSSWLGFLFVVLGVLLFSGITIVRPNDSKVVCFFGTYLGVIREQGIWLTVPLTSKETVSLRVDNFNSEKMKINDKEGNPVEVGCVVTFKVQDASKALLDVEDYQEFIKLQSETGIRHIVSQYAYDNMTDNEELTLRKNSDEIADEMTKDLHKRLEVAGVEVIEARIMHLAYSSEIASIMLQRQQAQAVLSARKVIVDGAVGMVKSAIEQLSEQGVVELDEDKKAQMVNNLMVALVSEKGSQPIVNAGSIY